MVMFVPASFATGCTCSRGGGAKQCLYGLTHIVPLWLSIQLNPSCLCKFLPLAHLGCVNIAFAKSLLELSNTKLRFKLIATLNCKRHSLRRRWTYNGHAPPLPWDTHFPKVNKQPRDTHFPRVSTMLQCEWQSQITCIWMPVILALMLESTRSPEHK